MGSSVMDKKGPWHIKVGERANAICNPIREIMDTIAGKENPSKSLLSLAQGDPTVCPHLQPSEATVAAAVRALESGQLHGYQPSNGSLVVRQALAAYHGVLGRQPPLSGADVFMTVGCSEALSHCIAALGGGGGNILLPRPGFPIYLALCGLHGVEARYYDLLPDQNWEIDFKCVRGRADENTRALLVNNPSNPCGTVYSATHMRDIMVVAEELRIPVIADEVYSSIVFKDQQFVSCAAAGVNVPVLSVGALSKNWMVPGWRVGWIIVYDALGAFADAGVSGALLKLCQVSLGPAAPLQAVLPSILTDGGMNLWFESILTSLQESAEYTLDRASRLPGISAGSRPHGTLYCMLRLTPPGVLEGIGCDDVAFARKLLEEESVVVLPGQCFNLAGFFRVVFAASPDVLAQAFDRIEAFCRRRCKADTHKIELALDGTASP